MLRYANATYDPGHGDAEEMVQGIFRGMGQVFLADGTAPGVR